MSKKKTPRSRIIHGELEDFFETGTEGVVWAVQEDGDKSYSGLHPIQEGDHLTILADNEEIIWDGVIACDRETGFEKHPNSSKYGQPQALGLWVHWTQKGFHPDDWARFFVRPDSRRLRGILTKTPPCTDGDSRDRATLDEISALVRQMIDAKTLEEAERLMKEITRRFYGDDVPDDRDPP
jgi:hypothetical protein